MPTLHDAIQAVLSQSDDPMSATDIAERISDEKLFKRKDDKPVSGAMVTARAGKYPDLFERVDGKLRLRSSLPLVVGQDYSRKQAHQILCSGSAFKEGTWGRQDIVTIEESDDCVFFVTDPAPRSLLEGVLNWQSQPQQKLAHPTIVRFTEHNPEESNIHLFLRTDLDDDYTYLGTLAYLDHNPEKEQPVHIRWSLTEPLAEEMATRLGIKPADSYQEPSLEAVGDRLNEVGLTHSPDFIRRYRLSLSTSQLVLLHGLSGSGKTWLTEAYAEAVGARHLLLQVHSELSWSSFISQPELRLFIRQAAQAHQEALVEGSGAPPFHLILDDINLAEVEDYLTPLLCRSRTVNFEGGVVELTPNLSVIGTLNPDGYSLSGTFLDRAQVLEVEVTAKNLLAHLADAPYRGLLLQVWQAFKEPAPFAYRTVKEARAYVTAAVESGIPWETALDEQFVQKLLPRVHPEMPGAEQALNRFLELVGDKYPLSLAKAQEILS